MPIENIRQCPFKKAWSISKMLGDTMEEKDCLYKSLNAIISLIINMLQSNQLPQD